MAMSEVEPRSGTAYARGSARHTRRDLQALKGMKTHERRPAGPVFEAIASTASTSGTGDARHGAETHADAGKTLRVATIAEGASPAALRKMLCG